MCACFDEDGFWLSMKILDEILHTFAIGNVVHYDLFADTGQFLWYNADKEFFDTMIFEIEDNIDEKLG